MIIPVINFGIIVNVYKYLKTTYILWLPTRFMSLKIEKIHAFEDIELHCTQRFHKSLLLDDLFFNHETKAGK